LGALADGYRLLGAARRTAGDATAARTAFTTALRMHESLEKEDPREPAWRLAQAYDCEGLGRTAMGAEDYKTAAGWFRRGLAAVLRVGADGGPLAPEDGILASHLRRDLLFCDNSQDALGDIGPLLKRPHGEAVALLTMRAEVLSRSNPTQDASESAEALRGLAPDDGANLYAVARCYALMAGAVARGRPKDDATDDDRARWTDEERARWPRWTDDERSRWDNYVLKGVEALGKAVDHGFKDAAALRSDAEIDALRGDTGYLDLLDSLDLAAAQAPK
jgi:hypothetical protein